MPAPAPNSWPELLHAGIGRTYATHLSKSSVDPDHPLRKTGRGRQFTRIVRSGDEKFLAALCIDNAGSRRGMLHKQVLRTDRPQAQVAAAVGAATVREARDAVRAPRALERADVDVGRIHPEVAVAALAVGSNLQHGWMLSPLWGALPKTVESCGCMAVSDLYR